MQATVDEIVTRYPDSLVVPTTRPLRTDACYDEVYLDLTEDGRYVVIVETATARPVFMYWQHYRPSAGPACVAGVRTRTLSALDEAPLSPRRQRKTADTLGVAHSAGDRVAAMEVRRGDPGDSFVANHDRPA